MKPFRAFLPLLASLALAAMMLASPAVADQTKHHYTNVDGHSVHTPVQTRKHRVPKGATAECRDGSFSFSQNHRGTCSHHGGVSRWL